MVAQTMMADLEHYLMDIGSPEWKPDSEVSDAENLVEALGRVCYRSWEPANPEKPDATNPNVTRVRKGNEPYLGHVLKVGHGSILEHANITFLIKDVSRIFTHEQVRHRAGWAYSQESLRFVRLTQLKYFVPTCIADDPWARQYFHEKFAEMEKWQAELADHFKEDLAGSDFTKKKELTSAFRRIAPDGLATTIGVTCNIRALRHVIVSRTAPGAEEEIRVVYNEIANLVEQAYPNFFQDMVRSKDLNGELETVTFENVKV